MKKNRAIFLFTVIVVVLWGAAFANAKSVGIVVKKGDSMWKISQVYGVSFTKVIKLNEKKFRNVNLIHAGDIVLIPEIDGVSLQEKIEKSVSTVGDNVAKKTSTRQLFVGARSHASTDEKGHFSSSEMKTLEIFGFFVLVVATFFAVRRILSCFCGRWFKNNDDCDKGCESIAEETSEITRGHVENNEQDFVFEYCKHEPGPSAEEVAASKRANDVSQQAGKNKPNLVVSLVGKLKNKLEKQEKSDGFIAVSKETEKFTFVGLNMYTNHSVSGWCACSDLAGLAKYMVFARGKVKIDQNIFEIPKYLEDRFCSLSESHQKELKKLVVEFSLKNVRVPLNVVWKSISNE